MNTFAHKSGKNLNRTTSEGNSKRSGDDTTTLQMVDQRPAAVTQRALSESLNQSAKVQSQLQLQQMFDQSPRVAAQMKLAEVLSGREGALPTRQTIQREEALEDQELTQRQPSLEEEEPLQEKSMALQREDVLEDEEPLQGKFEPLQRAIMPEDEEPLQSKAEPIQKKENRTGLPDKLKAGVENLSGLSMDDVRVHYNSSAPATVQALAYTQGSEIHVGPGQEQHLAHEAWHVAQQKQGRVQPTLQMKGVAINDDRSLEREADVMGSRAEHVGDGVLQGKEEGDASAGGNSLTTNYIQRACACGQKQEDGDSVQMKAIASPSGATTAVIQRDACYIPDQDSPYAGQGVTGSVGPGENFDPNQRFPILEANFLRAEQTITFQGDVDIQEDDSTDEELIDTGTITNEAAAVDHIVPQELGGCNTPQNAQVLSVSNNSSKSDTYPWGTYSGSRIYDLGKHQIFPNAKAARKGGADMTTLDSDYPMAP